MKNKASISRILIEQAIESLAYALDAKKKNQISKEIQNSINVSLMLGIAMEGIINEIGNAKIDSFTWNELEKASTPLKWRIVSSLINGFSPSEEPLQSIIKMQKIRNEIAHPKTFEKEDDIIISNESVLKINPDDDYKLPTEDFDLYIGFGKLYAKYNSKDSIQNLKKAVLAIRKIVELFKLNESFEWLKEVELTIKNIN
ncbi:hypothetical protein [Epilithonimonas vandammei]|uniref:hypothetical protein n=1 Tax=Epilithonimonas vandammei TaxID=2487072 RepID=UPI0028A84BF0|nr:hypothetical protein [Epilithonimonas vandammei]